MVITLVWISKYNDGGVNAMFERILAYTAD